MALAERLVPLAAIADRACEAMGAARHDEAGLLLAQLRDAHATALCSETAQLRIQDNAAGQQLAQLLRSLAAKLVGANNLLNVWMTEPAAAPAAARYLMGPDWKAATNVFVLLGGDLRPLAEALRDNGQARVVLAASDGVDAPEGVALAVTPDDLGEALRLMGPTPPEVARVVRGRSPEFTAERFAEFHERAQAELTDLRLTQNTLDNIGPLWVRQCIHNLPQIASHPSVAALQGRFAGMPMVVAAAGPSLDEALPVIREHRDKLVVVVVSRAAAALSRAGIAPDFIITADAADLSYHLNETNLADIGAMVLSVNAHPNMFERAGDRVLLYSPNGEADAWVLETVNDGARLPAGGSVACSALSLGVTLGCTPVCFAGLDLAFRDGRMYAATASDGASRIQLDASGTAYRLEGRSEALLAIQRGLGAETVCEVDAVGGGKVLTSLTMNAFRRWFEQAATKMASTRFINCSRGALIHGMEHRPLSEVVADLARPPVTPRAVIDEAFARLDRAGRRLALRTWLTQQRASLLEAQGLARRCRTLAAKAARTPQRSLTRLGALEQQLRERMASSRFVGLLAHKPLREVMQRIEAATTVEDTLAAGQQLYDLAERAADEVVEPLGDALARLDAQPGERP